MRTCAGNWLPSKPPAVRKLTNDSPATEAASSIPSGDLAAPPGGVLAAIGVNGSRWSDMPLLWRRGAAG
eukprot:3847181-Pyramimonas_sp.AAC.1